MKHRRIGFWYRLAAIILRRPMMILTRRDWSGAEHLGSGGAVVVVNHVSYFDPLAFAHFLYDNGRLPRFLAKSALFRLFFIGSVLRGAKQIPVYRDTVDAASAYSAAVEAVNSGELVAIYPEATLTRDPDLWPMTGKTGAARVALATGAPVIPVAQWGPQAVLAPYTKRLHLFPRQTMHLKAGPPVDLSEFEGRPVDTPLAARGHRQDHDFHHPSAGGDPRREGAGRTLRSSTCGSSHDGQPGSGTASGRRAGP